MEKCGLNLGRHRGIISWRSSVLACALMAMAAPVSAQQQYYVFAPGSSRPSVIVDLSVLEKLGPQPTLPGMLRSGRSPVAPAAPQRGGLLPPPSEPPRSQLSLPSGFGQRTAPAAPPVVATAPPAAPVVRPQRRPIPAAPSVAKPAVPAPKVAAVPKPTPPAPKPPAAVTPARTIPKAPPPPKRVPAPPKPAVPKVSKPSVPPPPKVARPVVPKPAPPRPAAVPPPPVVARATPPAVPRVPAPPKTSPARPAQKASVPPPPKATAQAPQVAAVSAATRTATDGTIQIGFGDNSSDLPSSATGALDKLITQMSSDTDLRVQLHGYANGASDSPSQARRLSLFRALSVRTYLMKKGVRSTRIDVRALGKAGDGEAANRVDVIIQKS